MAFLQYFARANSDCLNTSFNKLLEQSGLEIPNEFKNSPQIFAEFKSEEIQYKSKVNVLISWTNKKDKECSIEFWSDEPYSRRGSLCEKIHEQLRQIIPPKVDLLNIDK